MTINAVCRECNQGWLEDVENEATSLINALTIEGAHLALTEHEARTLGYWAYVRALLLTHVYPRGRVPGTFFERAHTDRDARLIPSGSYVSLGASTHLVFEAGAVQAATIIPALTTSASSDSAWARWCSSSLSATAHRRSPHSPVR